MSIVSFRLLGPIDVEVDGALIPPMAPRLRMLMAMLLLQANRVVPCEQIIERLWTEASPQKPDNALHCLVGRLRKTLGLQFDRRLITTSPGYLVRVEPGELDTENAVRGYSSAEAASRVLDWGRAYEKSTGALSLWRGNPLLDVPEFRGRNEEVQLLEELRIRLVELRIKSMIELGSYTTSALELHKLVQANPLREGLAELYLTALAKEGRRVEALSAYHLVRKSLAANLGISPGAPLQNLHRSILEGSLD